MTLVAGVDFGTQSVRVSIVDHVDGVVGFATSEYPVKRDRAGPRFRHAVTRRAYGRAGRCDAERSGRCSRSGR